jgi:hypothetical protein
MLDSEVYCRHLSYKSAMPTYVLHEIQPWEHNESRKLAKPSSKIAPHPDL